MKSMINKELRLAMHPASVMFIFLAALILIPNYPYYVSFFYVSLGIFFICLSGRENKDIFFSMTLPINKKDIVSARFITVLLLELIQLLLCVPFVYIHNTYPAEIRSNQAGMDANIAMLGIGLMMVGVFNYVFFTKYYKDTSKVGAAFGFGAAAEGIFMLIAETFTFIIPFVRDRLDTPDPEFLVQKLIVFFAGIAVFILLTLLAYVKSVHSFEQLDL